MFKKLIPSLVFYSLLCVANLHADNQITIMIDPAGHAKNTGRKLSDGYERAETLKFAEALKVTLEELYKAKALLTRAPGEFADCRSFYTHRFVPVRRAYQPWIPAQRRVHLSSPLPGL